MTTVEARVRPRKDTGTWEVYIHQKGRRAIRKGYGAGEEGRERAQAVADEINRRGTRSERFAQLSAGSPLPTDQVLRDYEESRRELRAYSSEQLVRGLIENHLAPWFGSRDIRSIRERDCVAFMTHLVTEAPRQVDRQTVQKGLSVALAERAISVLRAAINVLVRDGVLERNELGDISGALASMRKRHSKGGRRRDAWSHAEVAKILQLARDHEPAIYPVLVFLFYTGARRGEALGLKWDSVDFESGNIQIRDARVRGRETSTKNDGERVVSMDIGGPLLREVLAGLAESRRLREPWKAPEIVFRSPGFLRKIRRENRTYRVGQAPIQERNFSRAWDRLRERFTDHQIRPLVLHCARHTFVSFALEAGFSLLEVGSWVGHSSERMTALYSHLVRGRGRPGFVEADPIPAAATPLLRAVRDDG